MLCKVWAGQLLLRQTFWCVQKISMFGRLKKSALFGEFSQLIWFVSLPGWRRRPWFSWVQVEQCSLLPSRFLPVWRPEVRTLLASDRVVRLLLSTVTLRWATFVPPDAALAVEHLCDWFDWSQTPLGWEHFWPLSWRLISSWNITVGSSFPKVERIISREKEASWGSSGVHLSVISAALQCSLPETWERTQDGSARWPSVHHRTHPTLLHHKWWHGDVWDGHHEWGPGLEGAETGGAGQEEEALVTILQHGSRSR